jgi:hypothetical protein
LVRLSTVRASVRAAFSRERLPLPFPERTSNARIVNTSCVGGAANHISLLAKLTGIGSNSQTYAGTGTIRYTW